MRTLVIGLFILCAATTYADDVEDLEQRIDDLESEIDDLKSELDDRRSPRPALPALPPGWTWRFVTYAEDPVNWGWQKVPPPKTAEEQAADLRADECERLYPQPPRGKWPGQRTLSLEMLQCIAGDQPSAAPH